MKVNARLTKFRLTGIRKSAELYRTCALHPGTNTARKIIGKFIKYFKKGYYDIIRVHRNNCKYFLLFLTTFHCTMDTDCDVLVVIFYRNLHQTMQYARGTGGWNGAHSPTVRLSRLKLIHDVLPWWLHFYYNAQTLRFDFILYRLYYYIDLFLVIIFLVE